MCSRRDVIAVECLAFHSYHIATWTHIHKNILTDQYNGFVTLKDFELPDDGFDWGAETCWSDWSVINYPELICAFCWFIFVFINENARSKNKIPNETYTLGRTPLDEGSDRRRDHHLTTHNVHKRQTSTTPAGFEPANPENERQQTYIL